MKKEQQMAKQRKTSKTIERKTNKWQKQIQVKVHSRKQRTKRTMCRELPLNIAEFCAWLF